MQNKGAGASSGLVYVVIWGQATIPMNRIPTIGKTKLFDNEKGLFVEGKVQWSVSNNRFEFNSCS